MHGLYLMWWVQEQHVPAADVATMLAAGDLALMFFEVPTGWLADRCGHRISLLAGSALQTAGMLLCWSGRSVGGVFAAVLVVALGDALRSGADQALLYRSCAWSGRAADFQRIEARARAAALVALVGLILAGGAIVQHWGFAAGWITETAISLAGLAIAFALVEPPPAGEPTPAGDPPQPTPSARVKDVGAFAGAILPAALIGGAEAAASFLAQTASGAGPARMSALVAAIILAEAAGSACATSRRTCGAAQAAVGIAAAIAAALTFSVPSLFLPGVVGLSFLLGAAQPLRAAAVQRLTSDRTRARAASFASACDKVITSIALVGAGWF